MNDITRLAEEIREDEAHLEERRAELRAMVLEARKAGLSYGKIGKALGVSPQRVAQLTQVLRQPESPPTP